MFEALMSSALIIHKTGAFILTCQSYFEDSNFRGKYINYICKDTGKDFQCKGTAITNRDLGDSNMTTRHGAQSAPCLPPARSFTET